MLWANQGGISILVMGRPGQKYGLPMAVYKIGKGLV